MGNRTKLKKLDMTSVDLVRRGANQKADIMLYKSADSDEMPQGLWKSIQDAVKAWWDGEKEDREFQITKSSYMDALDYSMESIIQDDTMDNVAKADMIHESISQFAEALEAEVMKAIGADKDPEYVPDDEEGQKEQEPEGDKEYAPEGKSDGQKETEKLEEGEENMKIDKSRFSAEELAQYEALIAKGLVEEEKEFPPQDNVEKSAELHPEVVKALAEVEEMKKGFEMQELTAVAKKYSVLGKDEKQLADILYSMKKSSPESYDNYIALLDEQVGMVEKSGMFTEIGKSGHGYVPGGDAVGKIEAIASEIQKSAPDMSRADAIMKAWDQHPELLAEYENSYKGGK